MAISPCLASLVILLPLPAQAGQQRDSGAAEAERIPDGSGGIGIIGTLAGFGSVVVNGLEVFFDADVAVYSQLGRGSTAELRRGQVLAIEAEETDGGLRARVIEVRQVVAGPLQQVDPAARRLGLLGQRVEMDEAVQFGGALRYAALSSLTPGDYLEISGYRRSDGVIVATRVDRFMSGGAAVLEGRVTAVDCHGLEVEGLRVEWPERQSGEDLRPGDRIAVAGEMVGDRLAAARAVKRPEIPFAGRLKRLSLEGFAAPSGQPDRIRLHGLEFEQVALKDGGSLTDKRLVVSGRLDQEARLEVVNLEPAEFRVAPSPLRTSRKINRLDRESPDREPGLAPAPSHEGDGRLERLGRTGDGETTLQRYERDRRNRLERQKIDVRRREVRRRKK